MLEGLMQDFPLTVGHIRRRMTACYGDKEVVTLTDDGTTRATYAQIGERVDRLGRVLERLGVTPEERVATFAWNSQRHLELYFAVPCFGAVLHTLNVRLFAEQITYIAQHAEDRVVFVDADLVPILAPLAEQLDGVRRWVVMGDGDADGLPDALRYEDLLEEAGEGPYAWPEVEERSAAALCYTSGTTGNPKGVLYSHRSVTLHASSNLFVDGIGLSSAHKLLAVVPMFHVNAWGLPFAAPMTGAELVMPGRFLKAEPLAKLIEDEHCTMMNAVPTVFNDLLRYADEHEPDLSSLSNGICGGSAMPEALARAFEDRHGVRIFQAWGMTETSPICTVVRPPTGVEGDEAWAYRATQGRISPWVEIRLAADEGGEAPWDGESTGEIEVRGPWIASRYYEDPSGDSSFDEGWLRTGDIGTLDAEGFMRITDRTKDVIKSGGEWISSLELEEQLMAHDDVVEAAVIAKPDERWSERPLACVVLADGAKADADALHEHLASRVAKFWLPDEFAFIDEVPKTSTGKFDKKVLRGRLEEDELEGRVKVG